MHFSWSTFLLYFKRSRNNIQQTTHIKFQELVLIYEVKIPMDLKFLVRIRTYMWSNFYISAELFTVIKLKFFWVFGSKVLRPGVESSPKKNQQIKRISDRQKSEELTENCQGYLGLSFQQFVRPLTFLSCSTSKLSIVGNLRNITLLD